MAMASAQNNKPENNRGQTNQVTFLEKIMFIDKILEHRIWNSKLYATR
jgi:hypothetical protein